MTGYNDLIDNMGFEEEEEELEEEVKQAPLPPTGDSGEGSAKFEDTLTINESKVDSFTNEVSEVTRQTKTGGIKMGENLMFNGDDFLTNVLDASLYTTEEETLAIPLENKELYKSKVDVENVEQVIEGAFNANPKRVSFALEEIGLHSRLIEMGEVIRQFSDFTLIKTDTGNIVVHHRQNSLSDIEKDLMEEAKACLREGKRIIIPLIEEYTFQDELGLTLNRKRFRASFSEIKNFISRTQMKGTITKDAKLVIYE